VHCIAGSPLCVYVTLTILHINKALQYPLNIQDPFLCREAQMYIRVLHKWLSNITTLKKSELQICNLMFAISMCVSYEGSDGSMHILSETSLDGYHQASNSNLAENLGQKIVAFA
jgi:uncharacterized protein YjbI with pentapeptide repeats